MAKKKITRKGKSRYGPGTGGEPKTITKKTKRQPLDLPKPLSPFMKGMTPEQRDEYLHRAKLDYGIVPTTGPEDVIGGVASVGSSLLRQFFKAGGKEAIKGAAKKTRKARL